MVQCDGTIEGCRSSKLQAVCNHGVIPVKYDGQEEAFEKVGISVSYA
jgi:hypothetical protein